MLLGMEVGMEEGWGTDGAGGRNENGGRGGAGDVWEKEGGCIANEC